MNYLKGLIKSKVETNNNMNNTICCKVNSLYKCSEINHSRDSCYPD